MSCTRWTCVHSAAITLRQAASASQATHRSDNVATSAGAADELRFAAHKKAPRTKASGANGWGRSQPKESLNQYQESAHTGHRLRLPATAQGLVDRDDPAIQLDLALGLGILGTEPFALGVQQYQVIHRAFAVAH